MDKAVVEKFLEQYPKLENFIGAGTISLKLAREILEIDRWLMYDIFKELVTAQAVTSYNGVAWRATSELQQYLKERRSDENHSN